MKRRRALSRIGSISHVPKRLVVLLVDPSSSNLTALLEHAELKVFWIFTKVTGAAEPCGHCANHSYFLHAARLCRVLSVAIAHSAECPETDIHSNVHGHGLVVQ